ncbi:hypothetical protein F5Y17DRAFT_196197 [Xylariaceae sp. FL0594]|nr:hypothetical protein F5Y17DRAFT_196197 [Xylariaceae sp. FL0594]
MDIKQATDQPRESIDSVGSSAPLLPSFHQPPPPEIANEDTFENPLPSTTSKKTSMPPPHHHHPTPSQYQTGKRARTIQFSLLVNTCRFLALCLNFGAVIALSVRGRRWSSVEALIAFTWVSVAWNALCLLRVGFLSFFDVSIVLDGGNRVLRFDSRHADTTPPDLLYHDDDDEEEGDAEREMHTHVLRSAGVSGNGRVGERRRRRSRVRDFIFRVFWIDLALAIAVFALNLVVSIQMFRYQRNGLAVNWTAVTFQIIIALLTLTPTISGAHLRLETISERERQRCAYIVPESRL